MKKKSGIILWITVAAGFILVLLFVLGLLAPRIINLESAKDKIRAIASEKVGGDLDFYRIEPSIFPRPGLVITNISLSVPETARGTIESVVVYPKIVPLLRAKIVLSKLIIEKPEFSIPIPGKPEEHEDEKKPISFGHIKETIKPILAPLALKAPDLDIKIKRGVINIMKGDTTLFLFRDINADITSPSDAIDITVRCNSTISENIFVQGSLDSDELTMVGTIKIDRLHAKALADLLTPKPEAGMRTDLSMSFGYEIDDPEITIRNLGIKADKSSISELNAQIDFSGEDPYLAVSSGTITVFFDELYQELSSITAISDEIKNVQSISGKATISKITAKGPLIRPQNWDFDLSGDIRDMTVEHGSLPGRVTIASGKIDATSRTISLVNLKTAFLDSSLDLSASIIDYRNGVNNVDLLVSGAIGMDTNRWINDLTGLPPELRLRYPVTISNVRIHRDKAALISVDGNVALSDGPELEVSMTYIPAEVNIKNLLIKDSESHAVIALNYKNTLLAVKFRGTLTLGTLEKLVVIDPWSENGWIKGDIEVQIPVEQPVRFSAHGNLEGGNIPVPWKKKPPFIIDTVSLDARKNIIRLNPSKATVGDNHLTIQGDVKAAQKTFAVTMDIISDGIRWENIDEILSSDEQNEKKKEKAPSKGIPVSGTVRIRPEFFSYDTFTWNPVDAVISFDSDEVAIDITNAVICTLSTPGRILIKDGNVSLAFKQIAKNQNAENALMCLRGKDYDVTGTFDLNGEISAHGRGQELLTSLNGTVDFIARKGTIYRHPAFSKIFSLINITEVFRGKYSDVLKDGFAYDTMTIKGDIRDGTLFLQEMVLDGSTMEMVGRGELNIPGNRMDITLIAAPLKTVDAIVKIIPILKGITAGNLITVAMKVTGEFGDPSVSIVSSSMVGEGLAGMMKRTFKLPFKLIDPFIPDTEK